MAVSVTGSVLEHIRTVSTDPYTFAFTPGANTRGIMLLAATGNIAGDIISSVTFNGVSMTRLGATVSSAETGFVWAYFVQGVFAASAQNFVVDLTSASSADIQFTAVSLTTATSYPIALTTQTRSITGANPAVTMLVKGFDSMAFGSFFSGEGTIANVTSNANMTRLADHDYGTSTSFSDRQTTSSTSDFVFSYTVVSNGVGLVVSSFTEAPQAFGQAQAKIGSAVNSYGQAQAQILAFDVEGIGQAQADILQTYQGCAQAQAHISIIGQGYAQAAGQIVQTYFGFSQAQAQIFAFNINQHAQAQGNILQTYSSFAQGQASIIQTYQGYSQAQAQVIGRSYGQAQAYILQVYYGFSQSQAHLSQTYFGFSQAQATLIGWAYGQTQALIGQVSRVYGQSQSTIITTTPNAQAQARILQIYYPVAQSQGQIELIQFSFAQALAYIHDNYVGQAQALIDSPIKNQFGQAQAFICWLDEFTRTTSYGLGGRFVWTDWSTDFESAEESLYKVDGTKVFVDSLDDASIWDSYSVTPVPRTGQVSFDLYIPTRGEFEDNAGFEVAFGEEVGDSFWIGVDDRGLSTFDIYGNYSTFTISLVRNNWYSFKLAYHESGHALIKAWKRDEAEPDWQLFENIPGNNFSFTSYDILGVYFYFSSNDYALDNFQICTTDTVPIAYNLEGVGQAQALIHRPEGYGQAQATITSSTPTGMAQAYIAWQSVVLPFEDKFNRTTSYGLGAPWYLWSDINSSVDHPAASTVVLDGSSIIVPPNIHDSYYLGTTFASSGRIQISLEYNGPSLDSLVKLTIPATQPIIIYLGKAPTISDTSYWFAVYLGSTLRIGSGLTLVDGSKYTFTLVWNATSLSTIIRNDLLGTQSTGGGSWGTGVTVNTEGSTNLLIEVEGGATGLIIDNLVVGNRISGVAQAAALIDSPIKNKTGQARARVMYRRYHHGQANAEIDPTRKKYAAARARIKVTDNNKFAQAQALLNTGLKTAQAQALIGDAPLTQGYGQARAHIFRRLVARGQARARIKVKRWVWGQAQAYIKPLYGTGQAGATILKVDFNKFAQAQAYIVRDFRTGQAQAIIKRDDNFGFAQAQALVGIQYKFAQARAVITALFTHKCGQAAARISGGRTIAGQALALIKSPSFAFAQAQAIIVGYVTKSGNAQAFIGNFRSGMAQAFIEQTRAGNLVKYNNQLLPGYLQEESLEDNTRINVKGIIYGEVYQEYIGSENKSLSIRMKVVQSTYALAKEKVLLAGSIVRSSRDWTKLTIVDPTKYYLVKTKSFITEQKAGINERHIDYEVGFEAKPWKYGGEHSISHTTLIDTNSTGRSFGNGTWTPATIIVTGSNVTVSGYTLDGDNTGFISAQGNVNNLVIDTENYIATMSGQERSDLLNYDYKLLVAPGRTLFAVTGATSCELIYQDRWAL